MFEGWTWAKLRDFVGRAAGSLVITYFFMACLLIATAQQRIVERLESAKGDQDYSLVVSSSGKQEELQAAVLKAEAAIEAERPRQRETEEAMRELQRRMDQEAQGLASAPMRIPQREDCVIPVIPAGPLNYAEVENAANVILACPQVAPGMPLARAQEQARLFKTALADWQRLEAVRRQSLDAAQALGERKAEADAELARARESRDALAMFGLFDNARWPLVHWLIKVPPPLMSILLAFAAGLFGALLITLVLFVYPNNKFAFTSSNSFAGRMLLGGLIALAVVVLVFSGVAVLGDATDSQNQMAYAALGLLSGMFSDQAADWLSRSHRFGAPNKPANGAEDSPGRVSADT